VHAGLVHHPPHKKKPPLPSPFLQKYESTGGGVSHSKLTLYSQAQVQQAQLQALGEVPKPLKSQHQISSSHIPTIQQQQQQPPTDEEFRQTWGKMKPKISKQLPAPFNSKAAKPKHGKKGFQ